MPAAESRPHRTKNVGNALKQHRAASAETYSLLRFVWKISKKKLNNGGDSVVKRKKININENSVEAAWMKGN